MQALGEASEDPELKRHLRRHMREVHDFVADLVRRGQAQGAIVAERDADAEAWIMLAGGILGMVGRRVGLLDDKELQAIRTARLRPGSAPDLDRRAADQMKRPRLRLRGLLERRAIPRRDLESGSAAHPLSVPLPGSPAHPLRTSAWRPAWLQGALTIGASCRTSSSSSVK